jgi:proteasome assembly chaperone (PAC2) family protein
VPHTREPRLFCSVSNPQLRDKLVHYGVKFSDYEGPASIVTYLTSRAAEYGVDMVSFVSAIPAYVQGYNPKCIEAVIRRLAGILELKVELDDLRTISDSFEKKLSNVVQQQPELADSIRKLEEDYDNEIFDNEMGDLKKWLQEKGVRLD